VLNLLYDKCRCRTGCIWMVKMLKQMNSKNALFNSRP
jgi:hypothetical protein